MLSEEVLAQIEAIIQRVIKAELDARNLKRSPDKTAAERMARYRERIAKNERNVTRNGHRNKSVENAVTLRNAVTLPEWMPLDQWRAYCDMRIKIKKPLTDWAKGLAIAKLERLREQGHHPAAVLAQSAFSGWQGLFPIKEQ